LQKDLENEVTHMCFYTQSAATIQGLQRISIRDFLRKQAASEFNHVMEFSDLIIGLNGNPTVSPNPFPTLTNAVEILQYALKMEEDVVKNYMERIKEAESLGGEDGRWVVIFLEKQIEDSRNDLDNIKQMIK
jgi:bacterioferritin (cytochrome b1)